jgi:hypothetical protein
MMNTGSQGSNGQYRTNNSAGGILASGNSVLGLNLHADLPEESGRQDTASTNDNRVVTNLNVATLGR